MTAFAQFSAGTNDTPGCHVLRDLHAVIVPDSIAVGFVSVKPSASISDDYMIKNGNFVGVTRVAFGGGAAEVHESASGRRSVRGGVPSVAMIDGVLTL